MQDVTPLVAAHKQQIEAYAEGKFTITGNDYSTAVIVYPDATEPLDVTTFDAIDADLLNRITDSEHSVQILLIGTGNSQQFISNELRRLCREKGIVVDEMDSGAACRTYNVLLSEERDVAAILLPITSA